MESFDNNNNSTEPVAVLRSKNRCYNLTMRDWLKFITNLTIPLIIGVFTIFIAIHQQKLAQENRDKDFAEAVKLRKEDLERERVRREEDKESARREREEDKRVGQIKREEDKETARLQRELDQKIAEDKRIQEYELAEKQHNLYQNQRAHEFGITQQNYMNELLLEDDRKKDNILLSYQRELTELFHYKTITSNIDPTSLFILQMKTRTVLRILNPTRRTIVIQMLFQANLFRTEWKSTHSLLYKANVSGVEFGQSANYLENDFVVSYNFPDIEEADVRYASFRSVVFVNSPSFSFSNFDYTDWSFSQLTDIHFDSKMSMNNVIFTGSKLMKVEFEKISMNQVSFQNNQDCLECFFLETSMMNARLDNSMFNHSQFGFLSMTKSNLSNGFFINIIFEKVNLNGVDFSKAVFQRCIFRHVSMINCSMSETILNETEFSYVNLTGCIGFNNEQLYAILIINQVILPNGTLLNFSIRT